MQLREMGILQLSVSMPREGRLRLAVISRAIPHILLEASVVAARADREVPPSDTTAQATREGKYSKRRKDHRW